MRPVKPKPLKMFVPDVPDFYHFRNSSYFKSSARLTGPEKTKRGKGIHLGIPHDGINWTGKIKD